METETETALEDSRAKIMEIFQEALILHHSQQFHPPAGQPFNNNTTILYLRSNEMIIVIITHSHVKHYI